MPLALLSWPAAICGALLSHRVTLFQSNADPTSLRGRLNLLLTEETNGFS